MIKTIKNSDRYTFKTGDLVLSKISKRIGIVIKESNPGNIATFGSVEKIPLHLRCVKVYYPSAYQAWIYVNNLENLLTNGNK
jgi:hypothetical protein